VVLQQYLLRQLPSASLSHRLSYDDALLHLDQLLLRHINVSKFHNSCAEI